MKERVAKIQAEAQTRQAESFARIQADAQIRQVESFALIMERMVDMFTPGAAERAAE